MIQLNLDSIADKPTRDALQSLLDALSGLPFLQGDGEFLELTVKGNPADLKVPHRLRRRPKDVLVTSLIGPATVTFNYDRFTKDLISVTASGAPSPDSITKIRFFLGSFKEN
ncbi:hypothetical protein D3C87_124950 [compost metagenome]